MRVSAREMFNRLAAFDMLAHTDKIINDNPEQIIEKVQDQLLHGENANKQKLARYKNKKYAEKKHKMNPLPGLGTPDLKLTGAMNKSMGVSTSAYRWQIISDVPYFNKQVGMRGEKTMQLQKQNKFVLRRDFLYPALRQALSQATGVPIKQ